MDGAPDPDGAGPSGSSASSAGAGAGGSSSSSAGSSSRSASSSSSSSAGGPREHLLHWLDLGSYEGEPCLDEGPFAPPLPPGQGVATSLEHRVHVAARLRTGQKRLTAIWGLPSRLLGYRVDFAKILRAMKRSFRTNGAILHDAERGVVLQLQGDCWRVAQDFLVNEGLVDRRNLRIHGARGDGLAGQGAQPSEADLFALRAPGRPKAPRGLGPAPAGPAPRCPPPEHPPPEAPAEEEAGEWAAVAGRLSRIERSRGRRGCDPQQAVHELGLILEVVEAGHGIFGSCEVFTVLSRLLVAEFDASTSAFRRIRPESWKRLLCLVKRSLAVLQADPLATLRECDGAEARPAEDLQRGAHTELCRSVLRLDTELGKALRLAEVHEVEYAEYLDCTVEMLGLLAASLTLFQQHAALFPEGEWRIAACLLDAVYHLDDAIMQSVIQVRTASPPQVEQGFWTLWQGPGDSEASVRSLCAVVCARSDDAAFRTRAVLQQAYHHALHGRYREAQTLLALSGVAEEAARLDVSVQVLCNRTVAQLGLCAFRDGKLLEAHAALEGLCTSGSAERLLGQPPRRGPRAQAGNARAPDLVVPAHMHIAVEFVEAVHLACAALLEAPQLAAQELKRGHSYERRVPLSFLAEQLKKFEQRTYIGPPEDSRQRVLVAAKHLTLGEWEACASLLEQALLQWVAAADVERLQSMLRGHVKSASLQAYLTIYSSVYECFEVMRLSAMFAVDERAVRATVNRMMRDGQLAAAWDEDSTLIMVHKREAPSTQDLASHLAALSAAVASSAKRSGRLGAVGPERGAGAPPPAWEPRRRCGARGVAGPRDTRSGRNSRLRRDLINLNKAAAKWMPRVRQGQMALDDVRAKVTGGSWRVTPDAH